MKSSKTAQQTQTICNLGGSGCSKSPVSVVALRAWILYRFLRRISGLFPRAERPVFIGRFYLPYMLPNFYALPIGDWIRGLRPLLMFSYWLNFKQSGNEVTFGYHVVNVILHFFNGALIYLAIRKALSWIHTERSQQEILSIFAAGLFLFHPVQTESVSYVASRSETLSVFFVLAAYVVFLYRKSVAVSVGTSLMVLILFGAALLTKEHSAVLPAILLLTDYYWNPGFSFAGIRRNWKLYVPICVGAADRPWVRLPRL